MGRNFFLQLTAGAVHSMLSLNTEEVAPVNCTVGFAASVNRHVDSAVNMPPVSWGSRQWARRRAAGITYGDNGSTGLGTSVGRQGGGIQQRHDF